jgi:hypothetical protein
MEFPSEVLAHILRMLTTRVMISGVALTCKAWAEVLRKRLSPVNEECVGGRMPQLHGMSFVGIMDLARYYTAHRGLASMSMPLLSPNDFNTMRLQGRHSEISFVTGRMWTYWAAPPRPGDTTICEDLLQAARIMSEDAADARDGPGPTPPDVPTLAQQKAAILEEAPRWASQRVEGKFYVLLLREDGTVVVSADEGPRRVYVVAGMVDPLFKILREGHKGAPLLGPPFKVSLNLVPYRHYVSYDSCLLGAGMSAESQEGLQKLRAELIGVYLDAIDRGQVITRMPYPDGSASPSSSSSSSAALEPAPGPLVLSAEEAQFLEELRVRDHFDASVWVFRRFGYTEGENPDHRCTVISCTDGEPVDFLAFAALAPTAPEIVAALRRITLQRGADVPAPSAVMVDYLAIVEPLNEALLGGTDGKLGCLYYPPPSEMESQHAMSQNPYAGYPGGAAPGGGGGGGGGGGRRLRPSAVRIANGTRVRLRGLVGAAELNGRRGVVKAFAASAGRYTVELLEEGAGASQGDGRRVKIKMMNMVQELMIRRLSDGTTGTIMGILNDGSTEAGVEYDLELTQTHARERTFLPAAGTLLFEGTCARFSGLVQAAHLNGRPGIIRGADLDSGRYVVAYVARESDPAPQNNDDDGDDDDDDDADEPAVEVVREARVRFRNMVV